MELSLKARTKRGPGVKVEILEKKQETVVYNENHHYNVIMHSRTYHENYEEIYHRLPGKPPVDPGHYYEITLRPTHSQDALHWGKEDTEFLASGIVREAGVKWRQLPHIIFKYIWDGIFNVKIKKFHPANPWATVPSETEWPFTSEEEEMSPCPNDPDDPDYVPPHVFIRG